MIRFESVEITYPQVFSSENDVRPTVRHPNLHIRSGQFVALLGPSGCGKTTTLKLINRMIEPTSGDVYVEGNAIAGGDPIELRRSIGFVSQRFGLLPHMSVAQNVGIVPSLLGWSAANIEERVHSLLTLLDLPPGEFSNRLPGELSGGQSQRVALARALAARQKILLLDEPLGAIDPLTRDRLQSALRETHERLSLTTLLVTHDVSEALLLADRILVMQRGCVVQDASPQQLVRHPANSEIAQMLETPHRKHQRLNALWQESST